MRRLAADIVSRLIAKVRKPKGPGLSAEVIAAYNASRGRLGTTHICHAPFSNMYFNVHGDCAPCWLTFIEPDSYPQKSIREIWFGEKFQSLRRKLLAYDLTDKCQVCLKNLQIGNYGSVLARAYDINPPADYPAMMELELGNTCNLECVMCIGELSSSIRKNRDKLPPLRSPYDEAFVEQLEEFIPHLKELRFNGGEPFLIGIVFKIFEKVYQLNPQLKIVMATNGTVVNYKVKEWLNKLNIHINLSIDSLTPEIYETIRVNAHFDRLMENFHFYHEYCKRNHRVLCIMVNPMRNNWHEMPEFIRFVNKHQIHIWFNTIHRPVEWSLWALPANQLEDIYRQLSAARFDEPYHNQPIAQHNVRLYHNLVEVQIKNWWNDAVSRVAESDAPFRADISEREARKILLKKVEEHIYLTFNEGEEQKKYRLQLFEQKLLNIEERVMLEAPHTRFYGCILHTPVSMLFEVVNNGNPVQLAEHFKKYFLNSELQAK